MSYSRSESNNKLGELIVKLAEDQDQRTFAELFELSSSRLKAYALRCGANDSEAEELVQECLLTVWRKAHLYNPKAASASTWLYTIIRNKRIDLARKNKLDVIHSEDLWPDWEDDQEGSEDVESEVERDLNGKVIRTLLQALPDEQKQIVFKVYFEGKSHSEIAGELDLPLGTIKSRLRLAMKKLDTLAKEQVTWLIIILTLNF
ncbi:sigma-70 family RNA polymerase sigma factor [Bermanella marisrubri]|uniref:RNA polymerase sigma-70 factor n=1 Tax=Bermanella marisrubri TaxID=207949 RepID=Q1MZD8_9GAMM|nr:sigma-70 family RNA polymerase sigma factor [Bermanella marisrubri]EAT11328.1 RNA polymerase sigma-70 factor [Oceanobacter sp. RED65] [Bermanella marisrubri]QIZ85285.1 sigma-70 family RNA polymerase sigma factor [Bermanella marisrubri]